MSVCPIHAIFMLVLCVNTVNQTIFWQFHGQGVLNKAGKCKFSLSFGLSLSYEYLKFLTSVGYVHHLNIDVRSYLSMENIFFRAMI